ncbi:hypothetical protein TRFO_08665 [Tritrichomonas foetus]|uniref:Uncharacterized protein n=1 Tax=Tritrichomonas foetus TaxID=1144522 RepID=A0A1J4JHQ9_9EUKA|nr:hypothetical protein TRFO_08665 [Tritrichomonas foetus]|eukprot:OHS98696.1 hypothetical protein TRFO_08665 [Tritrichomonas foetus]
MISPILPDKAKTGIIHIPESSSLLALHQPGLTIRRSMSRDIFLSAASEIKIHFQRLSNEEECEDALQKLLFISQQQRFTINTNHIDTIFQILLNSSSSPLNSMIIINDPLLNQSFHLIYQISTFQHFFIERGFEKKHILILHQLLPHELAFKTLANILSLNSEFISYFLQLGFDSFIDKIDDQNLPLFIWFLGCFACYPELNSRLIPLYKKYVFSDLIESSPELQKHKLNVLSILLDQGNKGLIFLNSAESSINASLNLNCNLAMQIEKYATPNEESIEEMCLERIDFISLFNRIFPRNDCLKQFIEFITVFLSSPERLIAIKTSKLCESFISHEFADVLQRCFAFGNDDVIEETIKLLGFLSQNEFHHFVYENDLQKYIILIIDGDYSFHIKKAAIKALCKLFSHVQKQYQDELIENGICDAISLAFNVDDESLRKYGMNALGCILQSHQNSACDETIAEVLYMLNNDEYDKLQPYLSECGNIPV